MGTTLRSLLGSLVAVLVAVLVTWASSVGSVVTAGVPVVFWCVLAAFAINWAAYLHSLAARTERFYDLTGSLTYLVVMVLALVLVGRYDGRSVLLVALVVIWAARLGSFLFLRVRRAGSDSRFERILASPSRLLLTWTLQGLWVSLTLAAALGAVTAQDSARETGWLCWLWLPGLVVWVMGFALEVTADVQKSSFKADPANEGGFISTGVWAWSRHPNYFGEIVLWAGIALIALPVLDGWRYVTLVSPVFVYVLLRYISGVPMLERQAAKRWGDDPAWRAYQRDTNLLVPRQPRSGRSSAGGARP